MKTNKKKHLKLGLKIAFGTIGILPASVLTLAQVDVCTVSAPNYVECKRFFRDAMEANPSLKTRKITDIAMLASHDTFSDGINMFSKINKYNPTGAGVIDIAKVLGQGALVRLSRAQYNNVYDQLNAGVRYLDCRVTYMDDTFWNCHGSMNAAKMEDNLKLILNWLQENPGEFIMFHIYYYYYDTSDVQDAAGLAKKRAEMWTKLYDFIDSVKVNGKSLLDYDTTMNSDTPLFKDLTWSRITENGEKPGAVIFFSSDDTKEAAEGTWCYNHICPENTTDKNIFNPCALNMDSKRLKEFVPEQIEVMKEKGYKDNNYLRYLQTQTTPTFDQISQCVTGWSLLQKAFYHNYYMLFDSGLDWNEILNYFPIYMCDYTTSNGNGFQSAILDKLITFNKNLK